MFSERYKDVIDVSDKLTGITTHSAHMRGRLSQMQTLCEQLKASQLDKTAATIQRPTATSLASKPEPLSVACQLKLLSLMPENVFFLVFFFKLEVANQFLFVS